LKSSEGSRNLPLDCLWPKQYLSELEDYLQVAKTKFAPAKSLIFSSSEQLNEAFSLLTQLMKIVTGEPDIRFHHCRHAFCNWTWLRLNYSDPLQLADFDFCQHDFFSPLNHDRLCRRLGLASFSRKKWWALSGLLGHSSPEVTTSSYFHLAEFLRRTRFSHHIPSPFLLRKFWGQQLRLDDFGRLKVIPLSKRECVDVCPTNYTPILDETSIDATIELIRQETKVELKHQVTLRNVWEIICFAAEGYADVPFSEIQSMVKQCKHEGFVIYTDDGKATKIKSQWYLVQKWVARNPNTDKIMNNQIFNQVDEEYYGLIYHLRNNIEHYTALDEQNRLEFVRQYFSSLD
jgi:hypothetical protein